MKNYQELIAFLLALEAGQYPEVRLILWDGLLDETCPIGNFSFSCNGWTVTAFFDGGDLDYLDEVVSPTGEVVTCEELLSLGDDGDIHDRSERLEAILKAAIKAHVVEGQS